MDIQNILNKGLVVLKKNKISNAKLDAEIILASSIKRDKKHILLNPKENLKSDQIHKLKT